MFISFISIFPSEITSAFHSISSINVRNVEYRQQLMIFGVNTVLEHPIMGYGVSAINTIIAQHSGSFAYDRDMLENAILRRGSDLGLIGALLLYSIYLRLLFKRHIADWDYFLLLGVIGVILIVWQFESGMNFAINCLLLTCIAGYEIAKKPRRR